MKPVALGLLTVACLSAQVFTEDFESGKLDPSKWTVSVNGANRIEVQSGRVAHGKYALHVQCPAASQRTWALLMANDIPAALRKHHFGRAYVYITPKLPARHTVLLTAGTAGFPHHKYEEVAALNGKFQLTFVDQIEGGEDWHSGGPDIPLDRWFCLEWEFNDHPNLATIWVDGSKVYETPFRFKEAGSSDLVGGFTSLGFGFRLWGSAPEAFDIYYDDIKIDSKPVGPLN